MEKNKKQFNKCPVCGEWLELWGCDGNLWEAAGGWGRAYEEAECGSCGWTGYAVYDATFSYHISEDEYDER